jgi:hypothetical protein
MRYCFLWAYFTFYNNTTIMIQFYHHTFTCSYQMAPTFMWWGLSASIFGWWIVHSRRWKSISGWISGSSPALALPHTFFFIYNSYCMWTWSTIYYVTIIKYTRNILINNTVDFISEHSHLITFLVLFIPLWIPWLCIPFSTLNYLPCLIHPIMNSLVMYTIQYI